MATRLTEGPATCTGLMHIRGNKSHVPWDGSEEDRQAIEAANPGALCKFDSDLKRAVVFVLPTLNVHIVVRSSAHEVNLASYFKKWFHRLDETVVNAIRDAMPTTVSVTRRINHKTGESSFRLTDASLAFWLDRIAEQDPSFKKRITRGRIFRDCRNILEHAPTIEDARRDLRTHLENKVQGVPRVQSERGKWCLEATLATGGNLKIEVPAPR